MTIANSTLVGNSGEGADEILAPIADDFTAVSIVNSVVSGSTESPSPDLVVYGETNIDHSLVREPGELVVPLDAGNLIGVDPLLGPLANNGGSTLTMLPQTGSPVIDAGDPAFEGTGTDQRGQARVFEPRGGYGRS